MTSEKIESIPSCAWTLNRGAAQTFRAKSAGVLRVSGGRAWVTLSASRFSPQPRRYRDLDPGDIFVGPGNDLALRSGQAVVIESWPSDGMPLTRLQWVPDPRSAHMNHWHSAVVQPAKELGHGLGQVALACMRLLRGLASYSKFLVAGRGRVQGPLESNPP